MRNIKEWGSLAIWLWLMVCCNGSRKNDGQTQPAIDLPEKSIAIVYENDVHCAVEGYARMASVKKEMLQKTPYVTTVSCGDFVQGNLVGSVSQGEHIVDIMNQVGYEVVTLGNHEFDFGIKQQSALLKRLEASTVCCNFRDQRTMKPVYPPYKIVRYGHTDVAFIGITTTATATNTSPLTYQDEAGNLIYDFCKKDFYPYIQQCIDAARAEGADYIVALSHLGEYPDEDHPTSFSLIAQTTGLDAILDGHSHSLIPDTLIPNAQGNPVLLSSTGSEFGHIGVLTIDTEGELSTRLVSAEDVTPDKAMETFVNTIKEQVSAAGNRTIATNSIPFSIIDENGYRSARFEEHPLGNLCADAFRHILDTDIAMVNGGGIRAGLPTGKITYNQLLALFPFSNMACTATLTGQQLADVLECSVRLLPEENGSFMQVSGIRFKVDTTFPSPVVMDEKGLFSHVADVPRRVSHIYIRNKENGEYEPIDSEKIYTLASFDVQLKKLGSDGIFRHTTLKGDNLMLDVHILSTYIEKVLGGHIGAPYDAVEGRINIQR